MALVLFTGGARSGKSAAAEGLASARSADGQRVVVAVFGRHGADDQEFAARIARHQADRPAAFRTLEVASSAGWLDDVEAAELLVVDCLGTLLSLVMEEAWPGGGLHEAEVDGLPEGFTERVERSFAELVRRLCERCGDTIVVTNEVGDGVVPTWASARLFRDELGRGNRRITAVADAAYLVVAGRLIDLSALPSSARWPED